MNPLGAADDHPIRQMPDPNMYTQSTILQRSAQDNNERNPAHGVDIYSGVFTWDKPGAI